MATLSKRESISKEDDKKENKNDNLLVTPTPVNRSHFFKQFSKKQSCKYMEIVEDLIHRISLRAELVKDPADKNFFKSLVSEYTNKYDLNNNFKRFSFFNQSNF